MVCPSREDSLPIVMTEAMMYSKPCIASDSTGTADYIKDGINGFVCKTEDSEDLCEKMRYFIHHQEKIEIMGKEARKVYEEYFTMDKFADRLCNQMQKQLICLMKRKWRNYAVSFNYNAIIKCSQLHRRMFAKCNKSDTKRHRNNMY